MATTEKTKKRGRGRPPTPASEQLSEKIVPGLRVPPALAAEIKEYHLARAAAMMREHGVELMLVDTLRHLLQVGIEHSAR